MPRRRFTLIEMLVVIAIISVLASMLAPSLRRSLRAAHALTCLNNLRQIGVWGHGYVSDWHGFLPIHNLNQPGQPVSDTSVYTYAYDWVKVMEMDGLVPHSNRVLGDGPLACRELRAVHGARMNASTYTSYGLNRYMGGKIVTDHNKNNIPAARERLLSGQAFWFGDCVIYKAGSTTARIDGKPHLVIEQYSFNADGSPQSKGPWCWAAPNEADEFGDPVNPNAGHTGGMDANFVFGDGHVKAVGFVEFFAADKVAKNHFQFGRDY
ncbi:MAG: prepilin-type N-terminal cleavage/methylation domain-containing protein [Planctomycetes bacterium]|nr:prepilin-type N-terminal cleavage/methylation domain-containing protein [Planctomycetota bacterium]